jgi:hypothetical protein
MVLQVDAYFLSMPCSALASLDLAAVVAVVAVVAVAVIAAAAAAAQWSS